MRDFWQTKIDPMANASRDANGFGRRSGSRPDSCIEPDGDRTMEAIIDAMNAQHKALMKKAVPGMKKVKQALKGPRTSC